MILIMNIKNTTEGIMTRKPRWTETYPNDGCATVTLSSWKYFYDYVTQQMLDYNHYVWRGDRCDNRPLLPSLDRDYIGSKRGHIEKKQRKQLTTFIQSTCGRRGYTPAKIESENAWWALGQHHGLKTPLLDWTRSHS
jgi:hypothetical protein